MSELARRFRGLKVQIVLWMVLPLSLVLIGVAFTGVYSHEQAMRDLVQERDRALAVVSASQVRELLQERVLALAALAVEPPFHHDQLPEQRALLAEAGDMAGLFAGGVVLLDLVAERAGRASKATAPKTRAYAVSLERSVDGAGRPRWRSWNAAARFPTGS